MLLNVMIALFLLLFILYMTSLFVFFLLVTIIFSIPLIAGLYILYFFKVRPKLKAIREKRLLKRA
ncbi:MAG: hypothetical protein D6674_05985 [Acidobacteria bacterium]|jgi:uncharacterized membrane protein YciS (DUF1049 family)|nr:MAG: hypothetical protein D6674_05985 [Acidobacteriota bacterium]